MTPETVMTYFDVFERVMESRSVVVIILVALLVGGFLIIMKAFKLINQYAPVFLDHWKDWITKLDLILEELKK